MKNLWNGVEKDRSGCGMGGMSKEEVFVMGDGDVMER